MSSARTWHLTRFGLGLGAIAFVCTAYAAIKAGHVRRTADTAAADARGSLAVCAAAFAGSPDDLAGLGSCGQAMDGLRADAARLQASSALGQRWRSSRLIFLSLSATSFLPDAPRSGEPLAAFTERASRVISWWQTAQPRFSALAKYDAAADMHNRSATAQPDDFIYRLYRTKAALLLVAESASAPEAASLGVMLPGVGDALTLIDRLISAADTNDTASAETLRAAYLRDLSSLRADARAALASDTLLTQFRALAAQASAVQAQLAF